MVRFSKEARTFNLTEFFTVGEAAEFLGVSASTLRNWDRAGRLSAVRHPINRYRLYRREDLKDFLGRLNRNGR